MSITKAAELVRAYGRGNDSQLMHVTPSEVQALQGIARAKGGSLTINPNTGLPEAGFLEDVLPAVAGTVIGSAVGMPWLGAAIGGLGTYAMTGSLEKGLMAGIGAFGGANFASGLGAVGTTAPTTAATVAPAAAATDIGLAAAADAGLTGVGANVGTAMGGAGMSDMALAGAYDAGLSGVGANMPTLTGAEQFANMGAADRLSSIGSGIKSLVQNPSETWNAMGGFKGQAGNLGMMAAPLIGSLTDSSGGMPEPEQQDSYYRPAAYNPQTKTFTSLPAIKPKDWGTNTFQSYRQQYGYAEGGEVEQRYQQPVRTVDPAVVDYNRKLMDLAQQEYVQGMKMPGVTPPSVAPQAAPAPVNTTKAIIYDPAKQQFISNPNYVDPEAAERQRMMQMQSTQPDWYSLGYNPAASVGGGAAKGGRIQHYQGGGIVSAGQLPRFQEGGAMESDAFVVPADVVSALGNGSTKAGVEVLNQYLGMAMLIEGEGDGLSDDVPATIEGTQAARIADGEVYIPAETVTAIGEGDPEDGSEKLYEMMDRIRQAAHGKKSQQNEVNPEQVMPT